MINLSRFLALIFMVCFSSLFVGAFVYAVVALAGGELKDFDGGLYLHYILWSGAFIIVASIIAASPLGDRIASLFFSIRKTSLRDEEKINPALEKVKSLYREKYGSDLKIRVYAMDIPNINGLALGQHTVAVSTGLLKVADDDEIASIISHEAGHLYHGDGSFNMALIAASTPSVILHNFFKNIVFLGQGPRLFPSSSQDYTWLAGAVIVTVLFIFFAQFIFLWVLSFPVFWIIRAVDFLTAWPVEYRADRFSMDLGFGPAMVELFERIEDEDVRGATGFLSKYLYSHPPTALRIDRIERALQKA